MSMGLLRRGLIGLVASAFVVGCTGHNTNRASLPAPSVVAPTSTPADVLVRFSQPGLVFSHPRAWRAVKYDMQSSFSLLIVYLSNVALHDPCTRTVLAQGQSITCSDPLKRLTSGGVLVSWSNIGFPHTGPEIPHPNTTINGSAARVTTETPGSCSRMGGQATITADIARPGGNHYEMVACLRGPDLVASETLVRRMLDSTVITG